MSNKTITTAVAYYEAMGRKDLSTIEKSLHPQVHLIGPMAELKGKEAVLSSVKHFLPIFETLTIRAQFGSEEQAMVVYDLHCPALIGLFRGTALLTFKDGLIIRYELFYDASPFLTKKEEIFASS